MADAFVPSVCQSSMGGPHVTEEADELSAAGVARVMPTP